MSSGPLKSKPLNPEPLSLEPAALRSRFLIKPWNWLGLLTLGLILLVLLTWANYHYLNTPQYAHRDFMSLWGGGWAVLEGIDPYDPEIWRPLRLELGSKWETGDKGNPFPLWTLLLMAPLSKLSLGWGAAVWLTASQGLLAMAVLMLAVELGERRPSLADFALLALGAFMFRGTLVTLHNGQITIFLLAFITLFLVLMKRNYPIIAGFILGFIILKPNPFIFFAPLVALWLLFHKRWRVIAGGLTSVAILLAISWMVIPGWLFSWQTVREKTGNSIRSFIMPTLWGSAAEISVQWAPLLGSLFVVGLTIALAWYVFRHKELEISEVISLAIVSSLLITPYAWAYEHVLLLIPLTLLFTRLKQRWLAELIWIGLVFTLPWILYRAGEEFGRGTIEVLVPMLTALIYWAWLIVQRTRKEELTYFENVV